MKYFTLLILFIVFISCSESKREEQEMTVQSQKIDNYLSLAQKETISKEMRIRFGDLAYETIRKNKNDSITRRNYFKVANRYFPLYELEKYKKVTNEVLELGKKSKDSATIGKALYYLGDYFFENAKNDSAYWYYNNAEKIYNKIDDKENLANTILHKAYVLLYEKDFLGSETATIKALDISLNISDKLLVYQCYGNLGSALSGLGNYEKALYYHEKALLQIEKLKDNYLYEDFKAQTFNNIGLVYQNNNQYEKALANFSQGLKINNLLRTQPVLYSALLDNYAYSKFKLDNNDGFEELNRALFLRDSINNIAGIIKSKIHLTEYYLSKSNSFKALQLNNEAYYLAKESNYNNEILKTLDLYTKIDPSKGLSYAKQYITLSDSLYDLERATRNKLARIEYETDEIIHENQEISSQKKTILTVSILVAFIGGLLFIILFQRAKQKELMFTQEQQKANEEIYQLMLDQQTKIDEVKNIEKNRIARELHDGIMNKLASTRLNLFVLTKRNDEETIKKCIGHINEIQNIEKEVRVIAHELSNDTFSEKGNFKTILTELLTEQRELYNPECVYEIDKDIVWENIDIEIKMHLYRILQEALNNCNKYANAENIYVNIDKQEKIVTLQITDDGDGFNTNKAKKGIGMKNMLQRTEAVKGDFKITSEIGKGTTIFIKLPIN
ncbi:tetratricopeptide repeat protein [Flavobacterium jejuense]|uniref:Tetratricopeptide repeat protein n=1 Tax=Flavobacterium jejuense TaxID=1544455 RepID=A0ABX0IPI3_9FLAO|nr:tetratricopeptide repeat-containing sensor histidine kinase [Flavobacterium jejuense]NHN25476.1 tetratricopeptide repeat protein [Flavobacterium jejuense]